MDSLHGNEEKLREACCYGDIDQVVDLIQNGVNVNSANCMNGWTSLHWACQRGHSSVVEVLLRYGADPTALNHRNQMPGQLTALPHIRAKLGFPEPALTPSSPTNTPTAFVDNTISSSSNNNKSSVITGTPSVAADAVAGCTRSGESFNCISSIVSSHTNGYGKSHGCLASNGSTRIDGDILNSPTKAAAVPPHTPPPFSTYRTSPPPLLSSPPSSPSPPPYVSDALQVSNSGSTVSNNNSPRTTNSDDCGVGGSLSSTSSCSPPPLPLSPRVRPISPSPAVNHHRHHHQHLREISDGDAVTATCYRHRNMQHRPNESNCCSSGENSISSNASIISDHVIIGNDKESPSSDTASVFSCSHKSRNGSSSSSNSSNTSKSSSKKCHSAVSVNSSMSNSATKTSQSDRGSFSIVRVQGKSLVDGQGIVGGLMFGTSCSGVGSPVNAVAESPVNVVTGNCAVRETTDGTDNIINNNNHTASSIGAQFTPLQQQNMLCTHQPLQLRLEELYQTSLLVSVNNVLDSDQNESEESFKECLTEGSSRGRDDHMDVNDYGNFIEICDKNDDENQKTDGDVTPTDAGGDVTPTDAGGDVTPTDAGGDVTPTDAGGCVTPTDACVDATLSDATVNFTTADVGLSLNECRSVAKRNCSPPASFADIFASEPARVSSNVYRCSSTGDTHDGVVTSQCQELASTSIAFGPLETDQSHRKLGASACYSEPVTGSDDISSKVGLKVGTAAITLGFPNAMAKGFSKEPSAVKTSSHESNINLKLHGEVNILPSSGDSDSPVVATNCVAVETCTPQMSVVSDGGYIVNKPRESDENLICFTNSAPLHELSCGGKSSSGEGSVSDNGNGDFNKKQYDSSSGETMPTSVNLLDDPPQELTGNGLMTQFTQPVLLRSNSGVYQQINSGSNNGTLNNNDTALKHKYLRTIGTDPIILPETIIHRTCCCCCCACKKKFNSKGTNEESELTPKEMKDKCVETILLEDEIVLKIRVANIDDLDFIEVCMPFVQAPSAPPGPYASRVPTYSALLQLCCSQLRLNPHHVERIRKLPNTRLRCDADVCRLTSGTELEVVTRGVVGGRRAGHAVPSFGTQPMLY